MTPNPPDPNLNLKRGSVSMAHGVAPSNGSQGQEHIPELDGLRGLAIFLVVICHYVSAVPHGTTHTWPSRIGTILGQGATGVDLFFVLSGFLIGGILLRSRSSPRYYKTFYARRFHRIIPLYYGWLLLFGLVMLVAARTDGVISRGFRTAIPYWTYFVFVQNYLFASTPVQAAWLGPTWSLAVEEQFYLISPPLVRNFPKRRLVKLLLAVVLFAFLFRFVMSTWFGPSHDNWGLGVSYFWTPSRADDLALGMLTAVAWDTLQARRWLQENVRSIYVFLFASVGSILLMLPWLVKPNSYVAATLGRPAYGLLFTAFLIVALTDKRGKLASVLRWPSLRELGRISYCVYIIHYAVDWFVFRIAYHAGPRFDSVPAIGLSFLAFASTIALAEVSWHYLEHPLIRRGHRYSY